MRRLSKVGLPFGVVVRGAVMRRLSKVGLPFGLVARGEVMRRLSKVGLPVGVVARGEVVRRLSDLGFLFGVVAAVEAVYALCAILTPPDHVEAVTGWVLSADGKWLVKLFGFALASQAWVAWTLRRQPHLGVAKALALYQLGSATADWVMWIVLADQDVFATTLGQVLVTISIPTHYALGFLLARSVWRALPGRAQLAPAHPSAPGAVVGSE
jgi:hypothetical protein